ncbi:preprotein translocase subunit SecG [Bacteroidetes bacterium endosymbiont of Geopemphigus sp.]|uniref:preprotein translocase subunit SecG n=1 Tax=Bacteroidetes bacterium endosymbiont of Geopemphigus sp. TaxID=2047937 RepID=UPI000CCFFC0D|nr:preprotein translocase subunit SecG [Bacteroidetes bacterium endosymbiont of Geopemphigus sp.]
MGMYVLLAVFLIVISLLLLAVIMIQNPKGGGLSQTFGDQGSQMFGVQRTSDFLEKATWTLSFLLFILILIFNYLLKF